MFCITIKFKNDPTNWTLLFKSKDSALKTWDDLHTEASLAAQDDFGQTCRIDRESVGGLMFEDLDQSMLAHVERGLHNARTQAKAQQMAMNDPVLKTAAMTRGPAVFNPLAGNGAIHG